MNTLDIIFALLFLLAFFMGLRRGFLLSLASLMGVIAGVYGGLYFSDQFAALLKTWFGWGDEIAFLLAFVLIFFLIVLVFVLVGNLLTKVANFAMLGIFNKLLGGIFNVLKYAFVVSVIIMFFEASENYRNILLSEENTAESVLYGPVSAFAPLIIPPILNEIEQLREAEEPGTGPVFEE